MISPAALRFAAWLRRRWRVILFIFLVAAAIAGCVGIWFCKDVLVAESPPDKADAILLLGGDVTFRPRRAAQLYQQALAPRVIATGWRDCQEMRIALIGAGVPGEGKAKLGRQRDRLFERDPGTGARDVSDHALPRRESAIQRDPGRLPQQLAGFPFLGKSHMSHLRKIDLLPSSPLKNR